MNQNLNVSRVDVIESRNQEAVIAISISRMRGNLPHIAEHFLKVSHQRLVHQVAVRQKVLVVRRIVIVTLQRKMIMEQAIPRKTTHIILMMMDMMISIWMGTMIMIDTITTVIMQRA